MNVHRVSAMIGERELSIEVGKLAKQADGAAVVRYGDTVVLVTACSAKEARTGLDFFPLTCDYRENFYSAGKIPGGFFKREGKPSEREVLTSRMIDRPIRPLFPEGYRCETQIIALVLSSDPNLEPSMHGIIGASTALYLSFALLAQRIRPPALRRTVTTLCLLIPLLVAWARLYRGMHHLSDILVGAANGVACALLAWAYLRRKDASHRSG